MKIFLAVTLTITAFMFASSFCMAQEEDTEYSWGIIVEVSPREVVVSEYDYELEKEIDVAYKIDSDTELIDIESISDLVEGDAVEIDYVVKDKYRTAKAIALDKTLAEVDYGQEGLEEEFEYLPEDLEEDTED